MILLAIETSCDETAAAVLESPTSVLSNVVLSQDEIHAPYGGVVPELASRQHLKSIGYVLEESLRQAGVKLRDIRVFAATQGPGLIGSLLVGLSFAKGLAYFFRKPLVGIDHVEAHIEAAFMENSDIRFPALALLVSGGHTSLFSLPARLTYVLVGKTRDDAAGEALDKIAKFLGLGYPGGPAIEKLAAPGNPDAFPFAVPRMTDRSFDMSFSGLKTAALKIIKEHGLSASHPALADFLASFEGAVAGSLVDNLSRALETHKAESLILCGGVARNKRLRLAFEEYARSEGLRSFIPSAKLCSDNAAMVGALAFGKLEASRDISGPRKFRELSAAGLDLDAYPRKHSEP